MASATAVGVHSSGLGIMACICDGTTEDNTALTVETLLR